MSSLPRKFVENAQNCPTNYLWNYLQTVGFVEIEVQLWSQPNPLNLSGFDPGYPTVTMDAAGKLHSVQLWILWCNSPVFYEI